MDYDFEGWLKQTDSKRETILKSLRFFRDKLYEKKDKVAEKRDSIQWVPIFGDKIKVELTQDLEEKLKSELKKTNFERFVCKIIWKIKQNELSLQDKDLQRLIN